MTRAETDSSIKKVRGLINITRDLNSTHDLDYLLNKILTEARRLVKAEAGSIFLADGDSLKFCYVQNDKLIGEQTGDPVYVGSVMAVDESSLAGYAAKTGETLIFDDVYEVGADKPYKFNRSFDESSGYRTRSMLVAPLRTGRGKIVGVLQLINALDGSGRVVGFDKSYLEYVAFYGDNAAMALERASITRELILRTIRMAELRDPKETGAHVNRVAGYTAAIYDQWAHNKGLDEEFIKKEKDLLRVAAMLHDVGKVAISDTILKKPGRLDAEEYNQIKYHTIRGAQLFGNPESELDQVAQEIALNHHERWDGKGYPGRIGDLFADDVGLGQGKKGEEIPLFARVAALADVYDALVSPRVYKDPWPEDKVLTTIKAESGAQFDPDMVQAFLEIYDTIKAIRERYSE